MVVIWNVGRTGAGKLPLGALGGRLRCKKKQNRW
jgi:hypothetical protein